jgi:DNA polymerase-4
VARQSLHVDLAAFFVAVEQARDPSLVGKAVVVGGDPGGRGVVATASYEARKFGVHSAMPLRTATRLLPADAVYLRGDYKEYLRVSRAFHGILADCTPLLESGGLDEAYLDITGCEALIGTPEQAAATIRARIRGELGIAASVGGATCKLVAKVASDHAKPDGVCLVPEGGEADFLAPLPLRALPKLGASTEKRLAGLGLLTLGQLAIVPATTLEAMLGPHGAVVGARARGIDPSRLGGEHNAKSISREGTFSADVADPEHLRSVLRVFSESVGSQLRKSGRRARTVGLKLRYEDFTTISRSVTMGQPVNSDEAIFDAANGMLSKLRQAVRRPVRLIGVGTSNLVDDAVQLSLDDSRGTKAESVSATFDKVRGKYGTRSLQTGRTAFDGTVRRRDDLFERNTGLSSQIDH